MASERRFPQVFTNSGERQVQQQTCHSKYFIIQLRLHKAYAGAVYLCVSHPSSWNILNFIFKTQFKGQFNSHHQEK